MNPSGSVNFAVAVAETHGGFGMTRRVAAAFAVAAGAAAFAVAAGATAAAVFVAGSTAFAVAAAGCAGSIAPSIRRDDKFPSALHW